jgi:hypothetical protein
MCIVYRDLTQYKVKGLELPTKHFGLINVLVEAEMTRLGKDSQPPKSSERTKNKHKVRKSSAIFVTSTMRKCDSTNSGNRNANRLRKYFAKAYSVW